MRHGLTSFEQSEQAQTAKQSLVPPSPLCCPPSGSMTSSYSYSYHARVIVIVIGLSPRRFLDPLLPDGSYTPQRPGYAGQSWAIEPPKYPPAHSCEVLGGLRPLPRPYCAISAYRRVGSELGVRTHAHTHPPTRPPSRLLAAKWGGKSQGL